MHAPYRTTRHARGFTLLEMGIAIVVIGLITGGILVGQNMIRTAEVQSILSDFQKYQSATVRFQAQFASLPGDMPDATSHWTDSSNGNGDGFIDGLVGTASAASEPMQFWRHLQLAREIDKPMTGTNGTCSGCVEIRANENAPGGRIHGSIWVPGYDATNALADTPTVPSSNYFLFTGDYLQNGSFPAPILTPAEAMQLDTKMDNGLPTVGEVVVLPVSTCTDANGFRAADENRLCSMVFLNAF